MKNKKMTTINDRGYIVKRTSKKTNRERFMIKPMGKYSCCVNLGQVTFPKDMLGMKVRFKLEIINEDEQTPTQQIKLLNE
jgi:hypothetical protein